MFVISRLVAHGCLTLFATGTEKDGPNYEKRGSELYIFTQNYEKNGGLISPNFTTFWKRVTKWFFNFEKKWRLNVLQVALRWLHNGRDSVSNYQPYHCLLNRLFRRRSKKTSKLRVTGLCAGNSPGPLNSPHKGPVTLKMFPFHDVIMWKSGPMPRSLPTHLKYGMPIYRGQHQCSLMSQLHANSLDFKFVRMSCIALKGKSTYWLIAFSPLTALKFVKMTILYTWRPFCFSIRYNSKGHFFPLW